VRAGGLAISSNAYGSSADPPAVRALLFFCHALEQGSERGELRSRPPAAARHRVPAADQ
jgi:hypothetical protein